MSLLLLLSTLRIAHADCPPEGVQDKYFYAPVDFKNPKMGSYRIHYKLENGFATKKATLVMLHGGPGEGLKSFDTVCAPSFCFAGLSDLYNIVTVDERGAGCSILPAYAVDQYMTIRATVEDIEALRAHLLGKAPVAIYGVSFGSIAGVVYAAVHPKSVLKLIIEGTVANSDYVNRDGREANLNSMLHVRPDVDSALNQLLPKLKNGEIPTISILQFGTFVAECLYSYRGLWGLLPNVILQLNKSDLTLWTSKALPMLNAVSDIQDSQAYRYIVCREMIDPQFLIQTGLFSKLDCGSIPAMNPPLPRYDSKSYTDAVKAPMLILNGRWDSTTTPKEGEMLHNEIRGSANFVFPYSGHGGSLKEQRECGLDLIRSFLLGGITDDLDHIFSSTVCQREPPFSVAQP